MHIYYVISLESVVKPPTVKLLTVKTTLSGVVTGITAASLRFRQSGGISVADLKGNCTYRIGYNIFFIIIYLSSFKICSIPGMIPCLTYRWRRLLDRVDRPILYVNPLYYNSLHYICQYMLWDHYVSTSANQDQGVTIAIRPWQSGKNLWIRLCGESDHLTRCFTCVPECIVASYFVWYRTSHVYMWGIFSKYIGLLDFDMLRSCYIHGYQFTTYQHYNVVPTYSTHLSCSIFVF